MKRILKPLAQVWASRLRPKLRNLKYHLVPLIVRLSDVSARERSGLSRLIREEVFQSEGYCSEVDEPLGKNVKRRHAFADRVIWRLTGVRFSARRGVLYVGNKIIGESRTNGSRESRLGWSSLLPAVSTIREKIYPVGHKPWNYYHWLLEDLPAVLRAREHDSSVLVGLPGRPPSWVTDSLELAGIPFKILRGNPLLAEVVFPSRGIDPGWPHRLDCDALRRQFLPQGKEPVSAKKILISRRRSTRALENEEQLEEFCTSLGIAVVYSEELSFSEQISVFAQAELVVGNHGAGLANFVFSGPGAVLVEIVSPLRADPCFEVLARSLGRGYKRIFSVPSGGADRAKLDGVAFDALESAFSSEDFGRFLGSDRT